MSAFLDGRNRTMPVPVDISTRPDLQGTIPIETSSSNSNSNNGHAHSHTNGAPSDVAGVLRRNQACLACRRRKLVSRRTQREPLGLMDHAGECVATHNVMSTSGPIAVLMTFGMIADNVQKCDAVRPHCSTCVRSYRHLLRTAPSTNPTLACEYDDSMDKDHHDGDTSPKEDDDGKKKKRKMSAGRKKQDDDVDDERDRLMKRVGKSSIPRMCCDLF